jgi:hypothetical protein
MVLRSTPPATSASGPTYSVVLTASRPKAPAMVHAVTDATAAVMTVVWVRRRRGVSPSRSRPLASELGSDAG